MPKRQTLRGSVLPTVVVVTLVMLTLAAGALALWEQQRHFTARTDYYHALRDDIESAFRLYARHPELLDTLSERPLQLYDSLPKRCVTFRRESWGLYELIEVTPHDPRMRQCRLFGGAPDPAEPTLWYTDNRSAVTLAGRTELHGQLVLPRNGVKYGRVDNDYFTGTQIVLTSGKHSDTLLPRPIPDALKQIDRLFDAQAGAFVAPGDSLSHSFLHDSLHVYGVRGAFLHDCSLRGRIILTADSLRIDRSCRLEHLIVYARKVVVAEGARITGQLFARDTAIVERGAALEYPSGIYAGRYAELEAGASVDGYLIVRDTSMHRRMQPSCIQARTARVRGLLWVDGVAQPQGIVAGRAVLRRAVYFSPQGYYKDTFYDVSFIPNPLTSEPLWSAAGIRRKEAACVR